MTTEISCIRCICVFIYIVLVGECSSPSALFKCSAGKPDPEPCKQCVPPGWQPHNIRQHRLTTLGKVLTLILWGTSGRGHKEYFCAAASHSGYQMSHSQTALGGWRQGCHSDGDFSFSLLPSLRYGIGGLQKSRSGRSELIFGAVGEQHGLVLTAAPRFSGLLRRRTYFSKTPDCSWEICCEDADLLLSRLPLVFEVVPPFAVKCSDTVQGADN